MWQSMQLLAIEGPIVFERPQLCHWWQVKHFVEYASTGCSFACTSWHVEQVMFGDER
jgi:hypothetical protein